MMHPVTFGKLTYSNVNELRAQWENIKKPLVFVDDTVGKVSFEDHYFVAAVLTRINEQYSPSETVPIEAALKVVLQKVWPPTKKGVFDS